MATKISFTKEMETLLIPLYGRANMSRIGVFEDKYAEYAIESIDYDFSKLHIPKKIQIFMSIRGGLMDDFTRQFLHENHQTRVISLGSGLDARYLRVQGYKEWIDLDFQEVASLRDQLLPPMDNHRTIGSSVVDFKWLDTIDSSQEQVLVIAEGLLMYLVEEDISLLFYKLVTKFPKLVFIFDAYGIGTVKLSKYQTSVKNTGAVIQWGISGPDAIVKMEKRLKYKKTIYLTDEQYILRLNGIYQMLFRFAGNFKVAKEAHRIFVFSTEPYKDRSPKF